MQCPRLAEIPPVIAKSGWPWTEESSPTAELMPDGQPWPTISIVTPNLNYADFLEQTMRSVLLQGYPRLEYIVIDGGSHDGSVELIRRYENWITHWISEPDSGPAAAINKGFRKAQGDIIAFLGSDDRLLPGALHAAAWEMNSRADCQVINGDVCLVDEKGRLLRIVRSGKVTLRRLSRYWRPYFTPPSPAIFFRRQLLNEIGLLRENLYYANDTDLWLRMVQRHTFYHVPHLFAEYCIHPRSNSGRGFQEFEREWRQVCSEYLPKPSQWRFWPMWCERNVFRLAWWVYRSGVKIRRRFRTTSQ